MSDINLIVLRDGRLRPSNQADLDKIKKYKPGMIIKAKVSRRRNAAHHRKFFALLGAVVDHTDCEDVEELLEDIKIKMKFIKEYKVAWDGRVIVRTKSIGFDKMDQDAFNIFYDKAINVLLNHFLDKWTTEDIDKALEEVRSFG